MNILVAVDDSKFSEAAANAVIAHVKTKGSEVRLLCVLEPFPVSLAEKLGSKDSPDFPAARMKLKSQATAHLTKTAKKFRSAGFKTSHFVEEGDAREVILDYAEQWPADLIVVGSHGRKGMNRFLMGSVSEAVARYARCSVQIVRIRSGR
jgi:nucleotide-binding universal stress UspA family protein